MIKLFMQKSNHSPFTKSIFSAYLKKTIDFFKGGLKTMDQCTHEVRAEYWKKIIQACGQRPAGQSTKSWMRMASANKAIITDSDDSGNRRMKK